MSVVEGQDVNLVWIGSHYKAWKRVSIVNVGVGNERCVIALVVRIEGDVQQRWISYLEGVVNNLLQIEAI